MTNKQEQERIISELETEVNFILDGLKGTNDKGRALRLKLGTVIGKALMQGQDSWATKMMKENGIIKKSSGANDGFWRMTGLMLYRLKDDGTGIMPDIRTLAAKKRDPKNEDYDPNQKLDPHEINLALRSWIDQSKPYRSVKPREFFDTKLDEAVNDGLTVQQFLELLAAETGAFTQTTVQRKDAAKAAKTQNDKLLAASNVIKSVANDVANNGLDGSAAEIPATVQSMIGDLTVITEAGGL